MAERKALVVGGLGMIGRNMIRAMEDQDVTEYLGIPRWPVVGFITLALYSAAVASLLRILRFLVKPGDVPEDLHGEGV